MSERKKRKLYLHFPKMALSKNRYHDNRFEMSIAGEHITAEGKMCKDDIDVRFVVYDYKFADIMQEYRRLMRKNVVAELRRIERFESRASMFQSTESAERAAAIATLNSMGVLRSD